MKESKNTLLIILLVISTVCLIGGTTYICLTQIFAKDDKKLPDNDIVVPTNNEEEEKEEEKKEVKNISFNFEDRFIKFEIKSSENGLIFSIDDEVVENPYFSDSYEKFEVKTYGDYYILIGKNISYDYDVIKALVISEYGDIIDYLPNPKLMPQDGYIYNEDSMVNINISDEKIVLSITNKTYVGNPGELIGTTYYYEIDNDSLSLVNYENKYYTETAN